MGDEKKGFLIIVSGSQNTPVGSQNGANLVFLNPSRVAPMPCPHVV